MPNSNIVYPIWIEANKNEEIGLPLKMIKERNVLTSPRTIWPAVRFAASRNERVIGRTRILTVSTTTRNGFSHAGAPLGSKEAATEEGEKTTPEIIILNHSGRPIEREKIKWAEVLKK